MCNLTNQGKKIYYYICDYQLWDNDVITNLPLLKLYITICYHVDSTNGILSVEYLPIKQNHWLHFGPSILYLLVTASSQYKKCWPNHIKQGMLIRS